MDARLAERFRQAVPSVDFCSLRYVREHSEYLAVRQDVLEPVATSDDSGAMLTVYDGGGMGYSATSDLSPSGLRRAAEQARDCTRRMLRVLQVVSLLIWRLNMAPYLQDRPFKGAHELADPSSHVSPTSHSTAKRHFASAHVRMRQIARFGRIEERQASAKAEISARSFGSRTFRLVVWTSSQTRLRSAFSFHCFFSFFTQSK